MVKFPKNPKFNPLQMRTPDYTSWQEGCAHDPSLLEWEGEYYAFSTDTFGAPCGYQIRKSSDLLHWNYLGSAFDLEGAAAHIKRGEGTGGRYCNLQEAFDWCVTSPREVGYGVCTRPDGGMAFWAPHCVRGTDDKFWLYYCLTGYFGGSKSCIGLAKSDRPDGGFVSEEVLVKSPAGWRTPNCIDPQVFFAEGRMFLIYGSFGLGLYLLELDPATGKRKIPHLYADFDQNRISFEDYYGVHLASGSVEGGVIRYHSGVPVLENGTWVKKNYYYLMCSYGSLSSAYNMRCGRSGKPEGPYLDLNGNPLVCSTDIGTGNKLLGSLKFEDTADFYCPGHNDIFVTSCGTQLISYHCRTNYFIEKGLSRSNNFHYLYLGLYDFNAEGWLVMSANRYAGEEVQDLTEEELLGISAGRFEAIFLEQGTDTVNSVRVKLERDGTLSGAKRGTWRLFGGHYIEIEANGDTFSGVVMPAWLQNQNAAGFTITALGRRSGMALHMNSTNKI